MDSFDDTLFDVQYHLRCKTCGATTWSNEAERRDHAAKVHYLTTNHKNYRRWTTDVLKEGKL